MKIRASVVSSSFIFLHPTEDEREKKEGRKKKVRLSWGIRIRVGVGGVLMSCIAVVF